jgi:sialic acid synthase SpsE|tara:strand:- start:1451 stop:2428 length:978 start_codon:yes stop_codon:yes gene_type:complete
MDTFIIAEAGANHNKDFNQALKLIDVAKTSGASAVKFQTYSSETLYSKNTPDFAGYKNINQLIKDIELPRKWQKDLKQYCDEIGIEFMSTPFDEQAVDELVGLGVKRLKIAGFESTDWRFVDMVASTGLPLIISLGIGFKEEYLDIINAITRDYNNDVTLLHCNNAYPTPTSDINLNTIPYLIKNTNCKIGLSDHTTSTLTPAIAVAAGATTIEKHFTLDKNLPGPDHAFALEPNQLKEMIDKIAFAEIMMGGIKGEYSKSELNFTKARRSIVAKSNIKVGDLLTVDNITTKRPYLEGNVAASEWFNILGKKSSKNYKPDDFIKW